MFQNFPGPCYCVYWISLSTQLPANTFLGQKDDLKDAFTTEHIAGSFIAHGAWKHGDCRRPQLSPVTILVLVTIRHSLLFSSLDCSFCCGAGDRPQGLSSARKVFYHWVIPSVDRIKSKVRGCVRANVHACVCVRSCVHEDCKVSEKYNRILFYA